MSRMKRDIKLFRRLEEIFDGTKKIDMDNCDETGAVNKIDDLLSRKEPDYDQMFTRIKKEINSEGFCQRRRVSYPAFISSVAAAAILLIIATIYGEDILIMIKGYMKNANPVVVEKLSKVYERHKATLIIDDSLKMNLCQDTFFYNKIDIDRIVKEKLKKGVVEGEGNDKIQMNTLIVPRGGEFYATLPDGSEVYINSDSKLTFPSKFGGEKREVILEGEALFKVKKSSVPFTVICNNSSTTVLGTVFNIRSGESSDRITLSSGSVKVSDPANSESVLIVPDQQAYVSTSGIKVESVDVNEILAWTEGKYYFRNIPLDEIIKHLYDWYDIKFRFENQNLKSIPFTGMINRNSSLKTIFELFEMSYDIEFNVEGSQVVIDGKGNQKSFQNRFINK